MQVGELLGLLLADLPVFDEVVLGADEDDLGVLLDGLREFIDPVACG